MTQEEYNKKWEILMDIVECFQALTAQWHGYTNDAVDVDREGCFV